MIAERKELKKRILKSVYETLGKFPRGHCVTPTRINRTNDERIELW